MCVCVCGLVGSCVLCVCVYESELETLIRSLCLEY